jgi:hypothetical protein
MKTNWKEQTDFQIRGVQSCSAGKAANLKMFLGEEMRKL